jgi:hypothetical protein
MKLHHQRPVLVALIGASFYAGWANAGVDAIQSTVTDTSDENTMNRAATDQNKYVGTWVTADGYIRHELLPGGRYDEARGKRKSAYQGRYTLTGDHIDYVDDTGFTADGDFRNGILYHAGMVLHRELEQEARP